MNNNNNPYFGNDTGPYGTEKSKTGIYGWVYVLGIVGLVLTVISSYISAAVNDSLYSQLYGSLIGENIEDTNGSEDTGLCALDFTDFLFYFDNEYGYNRFDSSCSAMYYDSNGKEYNGTVLNEYSASSVNLSVRFTLMNYYDISYVRPVLPGKETEKVKITFSSTLKAGNMEAILFSMPEKYTGKTDENGNFLIDSSGFVPVFHFTAGKTESYETEFSPDRYYILAVAAESATGNYLFTVNGVSE